MANEFKITIIVPVFNVQDYIVECLDSITKQTYTDSIECILVDDCGKDNSLSIIDNYIKSYKGAVIFKILHHNQNKGLSAARNTGIKHARGEYLFFLDSDDKLYLNGLQAILDVANKYKDAELIQGSTFPQFLLSQDKQPEYSDNVEWIRVGLCTSSTIPVPAWNKLLKTEFVIKNKLFFKEGFLQEDNIWAYQLQKYVKKIAFCFEPSYWYRYNPAGIMHGISNEKEARSFARVFNYVFDEICKNDIIEVYEIRFLEIVAEDVVRRVGRDGINWLVINNNKTFCKLLKIYWLPRKSIRNRKLQKVYYKILRTVFKFRDQLLRKQLCNKTKLMENFISIDY